MRKRAIVTFALLAAWAPGQPVSAQEAGWRAAPEKTPVSYDWTVELEQILPGEGMQINATGQIVWTNTFKEPVRSLYFHAYPNAFRNSRSTFLREWVRSGEQIPDEMRWGFMDVSRFEVPIHSAELVDKIEWIAPDDGNPDDRTVFRVKLPEPVEQGTKVSLRVSFQVKLPKVVRRMGALPGFVMAAQWFPKLGVYVGNAAPHQTDGWYCPQYHANSEFYADYANYKVTLRVPRDYDVVASGARTGEDRVDGDIRTSEWRADNVVDFAWTAARSDRVVVRDHDIEPVPDARRMDDPVALESRRVQSQLDLSAADVALPKVHVVLLLQAEHAEQAERYFRAAQVALGLFGTWLGPYPYERLTIVDPPYGAKGLGGMEYPTLVVAGTSSSAQPETQTPESVVVHEICHQWLMNLIATNEAQEAWLDEGLTSFLTAQAMHLAYGPARRTTDILGFPFPGVPVQEFGGVSRWPAALGLPPWTQPPSIDAFRIWRDLPPLTFVAALRYGPDQDPLLPFRARYLRREGYDEMVKSAWTYADRESYRVNAYARPALFLGSLQRRLDSSPDVGPDESHRRFTLALREYAREFRFRNPTTEDFLRKMKETLGDPAPLVDQLVRGAATLDYAVDSIRDGSDPELAGLDDGGAPVRRETANSPEKTKRSIVRVLRRGDAVLPIVVEVRREGAAREQREWPAAEQAKDRWRDFTFDGVVTSARIDPAGVYLQDSNLSDNSQTREPNARPAVKWSVRFVSWLENALMSYGRFF